MFGITIVTVNGEYMEMAGSSTLTKPTEGIASGSLFMESDTGDVYVFDKPSVTWTKIGG